MTGKEVVSILMQRLVKVDGKVRTDCTYPAGFMDVIEIDRTDEHFRLIYDTKGRFVTHRITKVGFLQKRHCRVTHLTTDVCLQHAHHCHLHTVHHLSYGCSGLLASLWTHQITKRILCQPIL